MVSLSSLGDPLASRGLRPAKPLSALAAVLLFVTACGRDATEADTSSQRLPPTEVVIVAEQLDGLLEPLGLRITRSVLVDRSNGGYEPSPEGTHLGLYAEPIADDYSSEKYAENLWAAAAIVTPEVFDRWPGLESYDFCQEPLPGDDPRPEPKARTQVEVSRAAAEAIDWEQGDLSDLLRAATTQDGVRVYVDEGLKTELAYQDALAAAE